MTFLGVALAMIHSPVAANLTISERPKEMIVAVDAMETISCCDLIISRVRFPISLRQQGDHLLLHDPFHNLRTTVLNTSAEDLLSQQPNFV